MFVSMLWCCWLFVVVRHGIVAYSCSPWYQLVTMGLVFFVVGSCGLLLVIIVVGDGVVVVGDRCSWFDHVGLGLAKN